MTVAVLKTYAFGEGLSGANTTKFFSWEDESGTGGTTNYVTFAELVAFMQDAIDLSSPLSIGLANVLARSRDQQEAENLLDTEMLDKETVVDFTRDPVNVFRFRTRG